MDLQRLDQFLTQQHSSLSRTVIARAIQRGRVKVNGTVRNKPGFLVHKNDVIEADLAQKYVGYAGHKLEHALDHFNITLTGKICLDSGLSTGGFADCLLQRGAKKVYGVDVGSGQIDKVLARDPRLVVMEKTNLKDVASLPDRIDFCTLDVSFTSVILLLDAVCALFKNEAASVLVLVKPQFEVGRSHVGPNGVVADPRQQKEAVSRVAAAFESRLFTVSAPVLAPRKEEHGNNEFFLYCVRPALVR
jgi:23S rRNA (cytidine1920-2'-O)/16S rRNA (cytidine1409-2'-O)-methyltransferase